MRTPSAISIVLLLFSFGCSSGRTPAVSVRDDLEKNQAKWAAYKKTITSYKMVRTYHQIGSAVRVELVVSTANDSITSCKKTVYAPPLTTVDCLGDSNYSHTVEYYFSSVSDLINSNELTRYSFNPYYGVPVFAYGLPFDPAKKDVLIPGFTVAFTK